MATKRTSDLTAGTLADVVGNTASGNTRKEDVNVMLKRLLGATALLNESGQAATAPKSYVSVDASGNVVRVSLEILAAYLSGILTGSGTSIGDLVQLAQDWAEKTDGLVDGTGYSAKQWAISSYTALAEAEVQADLAADAKAQCLLIASAPEGQEVAEGIESCLSYLTRISRLAVTSRMVPFKDIIDGDFVSNKYVLESGDLGMTLITKQTVAITSGKISLPYGLLNSGDMLGPITIINGGTGTIAIENTTGGSGFPLVDSTVNTEALRNGRFNTATGTAVPTRTWTRTTAVAGAKTNVKFVLMVHGQFANAASHTCTCTASTNVGGRTPVVTRLYGNDWTGDGAGFFQAIYEIDIGAAAFTGNVTVSIALSDQINGLEGTLWPLSNAGDITPFNAANASAQQLDLAVTSTGVGERILISAAQKGVGNITGVSLSPMTVAASGNTTTVAGSTAPAFNFGYAAGDTLSAGAGSVTYRAQFPGTANAMSSLGVAVEPASGGGGSADTVILSNSSAPYNIAVNQAAYIYAMPDATTYRVVIEN